MIKTPTATDTLTHFGVSGMKWGVRKDPGVKSAHRVKVEAKYLKKGFSNEEAVEKADRQLKVEKVLLATGAVAVTALAAYTVQREIGKRFTEVTLEAGKELTYINALGDKTDFNRRLYTSFEKGDTDKYRGMLATALRKNSPNTTIYETVLKTTETIKAPSQAQAKKMYEEFKKTKSNSFAQKMSYNVFNKFIAGVDDPQSIKNMHDYMKQTGLNENPLDTVKDFMNFTKSKGYNALLDSNDQFLSGYSTKKPLILFNAASSTVKTGQKIIEKELSDKLNRVQTIKFYADALSYPVGLGVAYMAAITGKDTKNKYSVVNDFFKTNPDSKLSYAEVFNAVDSTKNKDKTMSYSLNEERLKV